MDIYAGGILGLLILIADIWAILNIAQSRVETINKLIWIVLILVLPVIGLIIWWLAGPREGRA
ncbi:PLD nuclease N-terminal domain-containing protein [Litorivivens sp.]|uniref:PLD nuclease N-terminal domain-containing protein n=1 Tax=Litorivivens sp. TaxID=2020868 RepID=UPI0035639B29